MKKEEREKINNFIKENYHTMNHKEMAMMLNMSLNSLRMRASRLKIRKGTISNEIVDGMKLCSHCKKWLPVDSFNKDKYQPNQKDYLCRNCRHKKEDEEGTKEIAEIKPKGISGRGKLGFGKGKKKNEPIIAPNGIKYLRCKSCGKLKLLEEDFGIDNAMSHKHKNYCKVCISNNIKESKLKI